jgi:MATE family multidrug resistance protein
MRNLMIAALAIYFATWLALRAYGNAGLWTALLVFLAARGLLQAARYPRLLSRTFPSGCIPDAVQREA